jgi:hypothetical protein
LGADKVGDIDDLNKLMPCVRPGGLVVAGNTNTRQADARFAKASTAENQDHHGTGPSPGPTETR